MSQERLEPGHPGLDSAGLPFIRLTCTYRGRSFKFVAPDFDAFAVLAYKAADAFNLGIQTAERISFTYTHDNPTINGTIMDNVDFRNALQLAQLFSFDLVLHVNI